MIAVDSNVVVRLLVRDSPTQSARAADLFRSQAIFVAKSVMLETEWVLRRAYRLDAKEVTRALRALAGLPNVEVEDARSVADALAAADRGVDFAEALHIASSGEAGKFVTLDKRLARQASAFGEFKVEAL